MPLTDLLQDLLGDINNPRILWQALAIIGAVVVGLLLARFIRRSWLHEDDARNALQRIGVEGFGRVLAPLLIRGAGVAARRSPLEQHQSVHLLRVALPLFTSMALIRIVFYLLRRVFARHGQIGSALQTFEKILALVVWVGVALYLTGMWPDIIHFLEHKELPIGKARASLLEILQGLVSVVVLMMLALWAGAALEDRLMGLRAPAYLAAGGAGADEPRLADRGVGAVQPASGRARPDRVVGVRRRARRRPRSGHAAHRQ